MCFEEQYKRILVERNDEGILRAFGLLRDRMGGVSLALYGEFRKCCAVWEVCWELGLPVACICDTGGARSEYQGTPVVPPDALQKEFAGSVIAICREDADASDLAHKGHVLIPPEYSKLLMAFSVRTPIRYFQERFMNGYAWAFDFFKDEISKQTVIDRLRFYLCGVPMKANTACKSYYEDGFVALGENEVFVDAGAHKGESSLGFIEKLKSRNLGYAHIYAFEPDGEVYRHAEESLSKLPNITLIPKGLWSAEAELAFFANSPTASSSFVNMPEGDATGKAPVTSLDAMFAGVPDSDLPTFIKMDIEGSEREALIGGVGLFRRVKPKLAICAYHQPEDIFELPQTILALRDDYSLALRQHEDGLWDTILYAV
jgi:FkbM family methyltransferase